MALIRDKLNATGTGIPLVFYTKNNPQFDRAACPASCLTECPSEEDL